MKRRILSLALIVLIIVSVRTFAYAAGTYAASRESTVYHRAECHYVDNILSKNLKWFNTIRQAEAAGYHACSYCHPNWEDWEFNPGTGHGGDSGSSSNSSSNNSAVSSRPASSITSNDETRVSNGIHPVVWVLIGGAVILWLIKLIRSRAQPNAYSTNAISTDIPPAVKRKTDAGPELKTEIKSSLIKKVSYDSRGLCIEFTDSSAYIYYNVPKWVYDDLIHAKSPGSYFQQHIKGVYPYESYRK